MARRWAEGLDLLVFRGDKICLKETYVKRNPHSINRRPDSYPFTCWRPQSWSSPANIGYTVALVLCLEQKHIRNTCRN